MNKKYYIKYGQKNIETTKEIYTAWKKYEDKERYFSYTLKRNIYAFIEEEYKNIKYCREYSLELYKEKHIEFASDDNIEEIVLHKIMCEELNLALTKLPKEEYEILNAIFFLDKSERAIAMEFNYTRDKVRYLKRKALRNLYKMLKDKN